VGELYDPKPPRSTARSRFSSWHRSLWRSPQPPTSSRCQKRGNTSPSSTSWGQAARPPITDDFAAGRSQTLIIGVGNHEYRDITYTIEALLLNQTFDTRTNTSTIHAVEPLDRFTLAVPHNETREVVWNFTVPSPGYNRIEFLLFNETVPDASVTGRDRINASYRDLHLWVRVRPRPRDHPESLSFFVDGSMLDLCGGTGPEGDDRGDEAADRAADHGAALG